MFFSGVHVAGRILLMLFTLLASIFAALAFYYTWPHPPLLAQAFLAVAVVILMATIFLPNAVLRAVAIFYSAVMKVIMGWWVH